MQHTPSVPEGNLVRSVLLRMIETNKAQLATLEALAELAKSTPTPQEEWITAAQSKARFGMGRGALDARGIRKVRKGRAWAWKVSDIEGYLESMAVQVVPVTPKTAPHDVDVDPLDAALASGKLRRASE